ncbi:MAG: hypothetical protein IPI00_10520 [Flavobacteriales bacterium]|nr:hypothetical protein [Flavobacteriales bacterium]
MMRLLVQSFIVLFLFGCNHVIRSIDLEQKSKTDESIVSGHKTYVIRGTIQTTRGEPCSGVIACVSDTGIYTGTQTGPVTDFFEIRLRPEQFKMLRALQINAACCDTIIEKFNGATYTDSIIKRGYRLYIEPQKFMVMYRQSDHPAESEPVDTIWFKPPITSPFKTSFIILPKYIEQDHDLRMPVDTLWPAKDGTFEVPFKKK